MKDIITLLRSNINSKIIGNSIGNKDNQWLQKWTNDNANDNDNINDSDVMPFLKPKSKLSEEEELYEHILSSIIDMID